MGVLDGIKKAIKDPSAGEFSMEENAKQIATYLQRVERINALEPEIEALDDDSLKARTSQLRAKVAGGASLDSVLDETFAVVREAAWRALGLRHYDVQLVGGMALAEGRLAEMATGEGKTLVATLPATLYALTGKGSHVVTCSNYLARRDAEIMGQVYNLLGLSVGIVGVGAAAPTKQAAYGSDITYVTNAELGFDYLRDNLATELSKVVLRPLHYCIVDEADSILIDEARTPIIIADSTAADKSKVSTAATVADALLPDKHYKVTAKEKLVEFTEDGVTVASKLLGVRSVFDPATPWAPYIVNALKAKVCARCAANGRTRSRAHAA
jgi:preprotein translocase subunit SecA